MSMILRNRFLARPPATYTLTLATVLNQLSRFVPNLATTKRWSHNTT